MSNAAGPLLEVRPVLGPPDTILAASPSKSATHRAILLGSRTSHTFIENPLMSMDTAASLRVATALGARVSAEPVTDAGRRLLGRLGDGVVEIEALTPLDEEAGIPNTWEGVVLDDILGRMAPEVPKPLLASQVQLHIEGGSHAPLSGRVDLGNSGTTLRIATALAAFSGAHLAFVGDQSLMTRPMTPLVDALTTLGAKVEARGENGRPPVVISGAPTGHEVEIRGDISSQFISALLIGAQGGPGLTLRVTTPLKSAPYVDVTTRLIERFGGVVKTQNFESESDNATSGVGPTYEVPAGGALSPTHVFVPGDYSSAAFPLVAAAVTGGRVSLTGMDEHSEQGDRAILATLEAAGCEILWSADPEHPGGSLLTCLAPVGPPKAFTHSFANTPDLFPALAVLAARAAGRSSLVDAAHVRVKECDRIAAMAAGLQALGIAAEESPDALLVDGQPGAPVEAALLQSHDDHRILMAFSMLGLAGPGPLYITDPGCYHVSYPRFRLDVDALGGETRVVDHEAAMNSIARETPGASPEARP